MTYRLKGFTLIELIVVIGIISILAAIVIIAVNPARQFSLARNTQRSSDVLALLNAVHQEAAEDGVFDTILTSTTNFPNNATTTRNICNGAGATACVFTGTPTGVNMSYLAPNYLSALPRDPQPPTESQDTGYDIAVTKNAGGTITSVAISAPIASTDVVSKTISVSR